MSLKAARSSVPLILGLLAFAGTAANAAMVYSSSSTFTPNLVSGYSFNNFTGASGGATYSGGNGTYSYVVSAPNGVYIGPSTSGNALSTDFSDQTITISFTSGNVTAVGANFWLSDIDGSQLPVGNVTVTLSDLTSETFASGSSTFRGFTTDGLTKITSMTIQPRLGGTYATLDNLYVGEVAPVPEASTTISVALLCCAVAGSAVRNRLRNRNR